MVHRLRVELAGVETISGGERTEIEDEALLLEPCDVGAGNPEDVWCGAVGDLRHQLVLVGGTLVGAGFIAQADSVAILGVDAVADAGVYLGLSVVVGACTPAKFNAIATGRNCGLGTSGGGVHGCGRGLGATGGGGL